MRRIELGVIMLAVVAQASDDLVVAVRDGGADPSWPLPAAIRYDLAIHRSDALKKCYLARRERGEMRVTIDVSPIGVSNFRVAQGRKGAFSKCLEKVLYSLSTRSDAGTEAVNLQFGNGAP